ncbi:AfsR/SARP family transcriptional regulator [Amycolatopsis solani]|uniref:AfsR/SARP family transcriptional regulator n=1 Tax=Amycolatopsis solani TaxID=3028615 RepID=UPI0025AF5665|nr:AfsR/SARP family transcriptional regulator [Amycolatopsis sp. MEP2-6]
MTVTGRSGAAAPTARKPRQVLALLVLGEGEVLSVDSIVRELWDGQPPKSVLTTVQTYVMLIRRLLSAGLGMTGAEVARRALITRNSGYLLTLPDAGVDLRAYRSLEREGMRAFERRDDERAVRLFDDALGLWRGRAFADVELGGVLGPEVAGLEQSRLTLKECRIEAELRRGRHREMLSELTVLTAQNSYNENLHALYMLALHRSGHRGRALQTYHDLRAQMIGELGVEPSRRVQQLHQAVLTGAAAAEPPAPAG